jgi:hypothetical protein
MAMKSRLTEVEREAHSCKAGDFHLADTERAILLDPCECGHSINDHGSIANCWMCEEDATACALGFEALLCERIAVIVAARVSSNEPLERRASSHADDGEANSATCACGHGLHLHDDKADPYLCEICGDNTRCDYADLEAISADRWDEGWIAAMGAINPVPAGATERILWAIDHMPNGNPYRADDPT